ncbi:hypothetical protein EJB05_23770, partial [Eragrostis curvula]
MLTCEETSDYHKLRKGSVRGFKQQYDGEGSNPSHKCDKRCQNEHVFGNMYRCKLTGITHICDKNCNQRILYDNHNSLCRVSGQLFPLSPVEQQAVRGIRRKHEVDSNEGCSFKRRRGAQLHPSPFERSYSAVSPIPSQDLPGKVLISVSFRLMDDNKLVKETVVNTLRGGLSGFCPSNQLSCAASCYLSEYKRNMGFGVPIYADGPTCSPPFPAVRAIGPAHISNAITRWRCGP